jgi:heat shock protein HslJ
MSRSVALLACLGVLLLVAACTPATTPTPADTIQGIVWQWVSVTNQPTGELTSVRNPEKYTITFNADGTLNGKADCTTFNGTYSQKSGLTILGASKTGLCGVGSLDEEYLALLNSVAAGGPDGTGGLALETAGGEQRMLFTNGGAASK